MKKVILLLLLSFSTLAQKVQWVDKIIVPNPRYISANNISAIGILGYPDALKLNKENKDKAWHPNQESGNVNISVGFRVPMQIKQVIIAANCAIGNVTSVMLIDIYGRRIPIFTSQTPNLYVQHHLWHLRLPQKTDFLVEGVYLEVNPALSTIYPTEIDAIGITSVDTTLTYEAIKNTKNTFWKDEGKFVSMNLPANVPDKITKQALKSNINAFRSQLCPVISLNEDLLFFTAYREAINIKFKPEKQRYYNNQDIWVSEKDKKGNWSPAINIEEPVNTDENNAVTGISADGKKIYLLNKYLENGKLASGFSVSRFNGQNWGKPTNLVVENFKNFSHIMEFVIGMNEKVMLISYTKDSLKSLRRDRDLYVSFLKNDGNWTEPEYTGDVINTSESEGTPFIAYDSKTLYFSSSGFGSYGDSDIFMTKRLDSTWTKWSEPVNLGKGINTPEWNGYFWVPASGDYAFTCSAISNLNEGILKVDLYPSIKPEPVAILSGKVIDDNGKPVSVDIIMKN